MSGSCHWAQSLNDQKDFWHSPCWQWQRSPGLGAGVLSVGRGMVHHFLRMKVCQLVDLILQDHTSFFLINIRVSWIIIKKIFEQRWAESLRKDSKVQRVSASWLQQLFVFFLWVTKKAFLEVQRRQGRPGMPTSGVVVDQFSRDFGSWTTAIVVVFTAMPWHFKHPWIARKPEQGRFEHFDDQKGAKRTRSWNWKWLQNQIKLSRPFLKGFARFRLRSKCTCCLGNSRCSTVDEKSSICHDYPLVCPCFFRHKVSFTFSKPLLQKLFVHPPISTWFGFRAFFPLWPADQYAHFHAKTFETFLPRHSTQTTEQYPYPNPNQTEISPPKP